MGETLGVGSYGSVIEGSEATLVAEVEELLATNNLPVADKARSDEKIISLKDKLELENNQLSKENDEMERESQIQATLPEHSPKVLLEWKSGPDMPLAMGDYIQAVEIGGTVFVGGGISEDSDIVMSYDTRSSQWNSLPPCSTRYFSMAVIKNILILVGGYFGGDQYSRELILWESKNRQWTKVFPPMPTARSRASSTCYKYWLVVAGGYKALCCLNTVEILDVTTCQWFTGPSTPTPWGYMKSITIENTWYLMGGDCGSLYDVYSASLEAIVTVPSQNSSIWQKLTLLEYMYSCPLNHNGLLLAVGGKEKNHNPSSAIMCYTPDIGTWVPAGELPHTLYSCACITVSDKLYVFGGDNTSHYLKTMHYHN